MGCNLIHVPRNNILNILKESLSDKPQETLVANPNEKIKENEVRYKLIIDSSEDNSLLRLLFAFDILKEKETRTYVCSDFPGDSHQQMVSNTTTLIIYASITICLVLLHMYIYTRALYIIIHVHVVVQMNETAL